jgi:trimeric autotransporter adhesin
MTKAKISEYDAVAANNTDVNGVNIAENCPPSGMNNMGREIMAALKRFQTGSDGDGVTVGGSLVVAGDITVNSQGDVRFADSDSSNYVAFQAPATVATNVTFTLPAADGTSGQVIQTDGSGALSFATPSSLTGTTDSATPFETALGSGAGAVNTGVNNTFIGFDAGNDNTSGTDNTAVGYQALDANTTGTCNVAIGQSALGANTTGNCNTAVGTNALLAATTACHNNALGERSLCSNTTGAENTSIGRYTLPFNTTGVCNTALGNGALNNNTTGGHNTALGVQALHAATTGCNNIAVGIYSGTTVFSPSGLVNITTQSNRIVFGNNDHTCAQIKIAWTATSDCRDKTCFAPIALGLDFVRALKPTEYQFKQGGRDSTATDGKRRYGFLAQEMLPLEGDNPVIISADDPDKLQYTEAHLIPVLVKAIQELTARVEQLENA